MSSTTAAARAKNAGQILKDYQDLCNEYKNLQEQYTKLQEENEKCIAENKRQKLQLAENAQRLSNYELELVVLENEKQSIQNSLLSVSRTLNANKSSNADSIYEDTADSVPSNIGPNLLESAFILDESNVQQEDRRNNTNTNTIPPVTVNNQPGPSHTQPGPSNRQEQGTKNPCVILGDSHIRDFQKYMEDTGDKPHEYNIQCHPGKRLIDLHNTCEVDEDGYLIIMGGTNDVFKTSYTKIERHLINILKEYGTKTKIIIISIPYRYNTPSANIHIQRVNRKMRSVVNVFKNSIFLDINKRLKRSHYGNDKLHLNAEGKRKMCLAIHKIFNNPNIFNNKNTYGVTRTNPQLKQRNNTSKLGRKQAGKRVKFEKETKQQKGKQTQVHAKYNQRGTIPKENQKKNNYQDRPNHAQKMKPVLSSNKTKIPVVHRSNQKQTSQNYTASSSNDIYAQTIQNTIQPTTPSTTNSSHYQTPVVQMKQWLQPIQEDPVLWPQSQATHPNPNQLPSPNNPQWPQSSQPTPPTWSQPNPPPWTQPTPPLWSQPSPPPWPQSTPPPWPQPVHPTPTPHSQAIQPCQSHWIQPQIQPNSNSSLVPFNNQPNVIPATPNICGHIFDYSRQCQRYGYSSQ
jgi:Uncharacterized protein containing TOPRIM domain, potential nuclease